MRTRQRAGPARATRNGLALLEGLRLKYADDDATTSAIVAITHLHLLVTLEEAHPRI